MGYLINTIKDVDLLVKKRIIVNHVGDTESIANMFNRICSHIALSGSPYYVDFEEMKTHYNGSP